MSELVFIDLARGNCRLGGSILAQCLKQVGDNCPDVEDVPLLKRAFQVIQNFNYRFSNLILAGHDVSDGGLITTLLEMAFAGNCGFDINLTGQQNIYERLFAEELGLVIEVPMENARLACRAFGEIDIPFYQLGMTREKQDLIVRYNDDVVFSAQLPEVRGWWEETSYQIERLQADPDCAYEEKAAIYERTNPAYTVSFTPIRSVETPDAVRRELPVAILREEGSNGDREMTSAFYRAGFEVWDVNMKDLLDGRVSLKQFRGLVAVGGFSYADYPDSAKGWAAVIRENPRISKMFDEFYERPDTFSLGVCNGCQLFALLGWVPWRGIHDQDQPRFVRNRSGRFESRWSMVRITTSPAIMLRGMNGSNLGIWVAHGEGRLYFPNASIMDEMIDRELISMVFTNDSSVATEQYLFNPNGSPYGITGICTPDGRHLAMMPHPERAFLKWQWPWLPEKLDREWVTSPWLKMFRNAYNWCVENK